MRQCTGLRRRRLKLQGTCPSAQRPLHVVRLGRKCAHRTSLSLPSRALLGASVGEIVRGPQRVSSELQPSRVRSPAPSAKSRRQGACKPAARARTPRATSLEAFVTGQKHSDLVAKAQTPLQFCACAPACLLFCSCFFQCNFAWLQSGHLAILLSQSRCPPRR